MDVEAILEGLRDGTIQEGKWGHLWKKDGDKWRMFAIWDEEGIRFCYD